MSEGGQGRARGRASRGRARGAPAAAAPSLQAAAAAGGGGGPAPVQPPPPSAWGRSQPPAQPPKQPLPPTTARGKQTQQPQQPQPGYDVRAEAKLAPGVQDVSGAFRGMQISGGAGGPAAPGASSAERPGMQRRGAMRGRSEIAPPLHTKPQSCSSKIGTDGMKINVLSNHFKLVKTTDWSLFQYWVDFSHDEDRTKVRKGLLKNHKDTIGEGYMFDGAMLFTIKKIAMGPDGTKELYSTREYDQEKIRITIKFVNELALGDYMYIQLFNIILRNCIDSLDFQLVGREYFDPHSKEVLPNFKLEIWPGFVTSILQFEHNVMMCVDVSHKVLRKDTVLEFMIECKKRFREDWKEKFEEAILGNTVFTHYNNKPYRVDDVDFDSTPASTFKKGNADVQYVQYYREKYNINVRDMSQPLLISKPKAKDLRGGRDQNVVLIPELCNMTGLSNEMRSNFQLMKAVADKTRIPPAGRIKQYYQFMDRMNRTQAVATKLQQWSMKFSPKLEEVPARRFPPEKMIQGNQREFTYGDDGDWTRNIRGGSMLASIPLKKWAIVAPAMLMDKRGQGMIDNFLSELKKAADSLRFEMHPPMKVASEQDKAAGFYTAIEKVMSKGEVELVMCIVPNNRTDIYNSIKKKCCVDRPVPSQVIAVKTLNHKNLLSVATKIVIQMNCKLGGAPWYVPIPFVTAEKKPDPTMIIGFDVCHDSNMKAKSYGALVASLDYYYTKFYSAVSNHAFGEELSNDIATHFTHAVIRYRELNGRLPTRIVMYRDGVGESNIPFVLDHEIEAIKKRYYEVFPGAELKMAVIVVSKRIQTRIFLNNDNPPPGTVVDDVITRPEKFDFFIVSQSVKQGTVTPTSYNVIYDTTGLKAGIIQRITYKMTHMYYNCSCTVRVPAQVQYAHKLAFLVGQAIHQSPSTDLNGQLYFL